MEFISFDLLNAKGDLLKYKLNNESTENYLTNVASHLSGIYKFKNPEKGSENDKFMIKYSGNIKSIDDSRDVAHYVLIKEKEASKYLIAVDFFKLNFVEI